ncbi:hypothetical protein [Klebsiella spallanzanii]|uniref:Uncharacterized protein n=1 Tax=Klebsiella spallanzanii TaxID=2587528 RepID=A0A564J8E5_9ENTR|nr:hypothetical protein [Klebsiella spallanzanii]VUS54062.1 hypothetical protein SB6408_04567 [Klebsiella spallanzanii]
MNVDVYNSLKHKTKFLLVPHGSEVTGENLNIKDPDFSKIALFKANVPLEQSIIGPDPAKAQADIAEKGYHVCEIAINIKIQ